MRGGRVQNHCGEDRSIFDKSGMVLCPTSVPVSCCGKASRRKGALLTGHRCPAVQCQ